MSDEVRYAGFWVRAAAALIDSVLVSMIVAPPLYWIYGKGYFTQMFDLGPLLDPDRLLEDMQSSQIGQGPADVLLTWVLPAVGVVLFWMARSATPGKIWLSLKIVDADTLGPVRPAQAIGRYLGYYLSMFGLFLGFLWVAFDPRKQGWHDKVAGTVVIKVPK